MNEIATFDGMMDSREIAKATGKQHRNVLRDIRAMLKGLEIGVLSFEHSYLNTQGKAQPYFRLPRRECLALATGYDVKLRAKIIDRWIELEVEHYKGIRIEQTPDQQEIIRLRGVIEGLTMRIGGPAKVRNTEPRPRPRSMSEEIRFLDRLSGWMEGKAEISMDQIFEEVAKPVGIQRDHSAEIRVGRALHASGWHPHQVRADGGRERIYRR